MGRPSVYVLCAVCLVKHELFIEENVAGSSSSREILKTLHKILDDFELNLYQQIKTNISFPLLI